MNRHFFRLPYSSERTYAPIILVVNPQGQYYWSRQHIPGTPGHYDGTVSQSDAITLANSGMYLELRPGVNLDFILNDVVAEGGTAAAWRQALAPYSQPTAAFKSWTNHRFKTNHKIGVPKGRLP